MTEDINTQELTKDLTDSEKLDWLIRFITVMDSRLRKVESFVDDRSRDTRPKLELIHKEIADTRVELAEVNTKVSKLDRKFESLILDVNEVRVEQRGHEKRLALLERGAIQ